MPEVDPKVMKFVEDVLRSRPDTPNRDLFEETKAAHASVRVLTARQFNARYPLQVKRRQALSDRDGVKGGKGPGPRARKRSPSARGPSNASRDQVRQVLLDFATDITAAEERKDLVRVLAGVDSYVERILRELAKG